MSLTMTADYDVLVIGNPCVDLVFSGMAHWPVPGKELYVPDFGIGAGAAFNTAATLSRLGLRVALLCELGNDLFSRFIRSEIERAGISCDLLMMREHPLRAVSICLAHEGERGFVSYADRPQGLTSHLEFEAASAEALPGAWPPDFRQPEFQRLLTGCSFEAVFLYATPSIHPLLDLLEKQQARIFFDTGWNPQTLADPRLPGVLRRGEVAMPNQVEAELITGQQTPEAAALKLSEWLATAIVKVGAQGVIACQQGQLQTCSAYPIPEVVDTTGAGDAFNGGFIYGMLKGYPLADALRCGTICGSLATTAITGTAAVPDACELERRRLQS